ncbi:hypothetical protein ASPBRDRAFT_38821 [Aspergillus brasiliensis CBS 101740]|uniref:Uncharacterized protein n=1 Tax=Aspergillus brasiliensis (strain CBS 101740 / IMI 381727 / IBT 21946) TaxID=767769 RepID=A0A1L9UXJ3_ASPBC|nr:hypothetical protein ASPBRDRAFT_38821 [Aspergillus brasiliensis CBS 101740]
MTVIFTSLYFLPPIPDSSSPSPATPICPFPVAPFSLHNFSLAPFPSFFLLPSSSSLRPPNPRGERKSPPFKPSRKSLGPRTPWCWP